LLSFFPQLNQSPVCILAVANGMDAQRVVGFFGETHAVIAHAKAQLANLSLQLLDVPLASLGEAMDGKEDAHGGVAVEAADGGAGALGPAIFFTPSLSASSDRLG
jgi:hypothetical protein